MNKPGKPKNPQKQNLEGVSARDTFQTPNYAVDLLVPFLSNTVAYKIWECAAGLGKISKRLEHHGFECIATDLSYDKPLNFLTDEPPDYFDAIVTNTPFSLKQKFFDKCIYYSKPFALLVPADYSGLTINAVKQWGCEKIIPERRIDFITPNILQRIWQGETWLWLLADSPEQMKEEGWTKGEKSMKLFAESNPLSWQRALKINVNHCYNSIYDVPAKLLKKYSSSYYHSMWLTWGLGIGQSETFVKLGNEDKMNI